MSTDKLRAEFEAWAGGPEFSLTPGHFKNGEDGEYVNYATINYWECFRAGRATAVVEMPEAYTFRAQLDCEQLYDIQQAVREQDRAAIEAAGVTVK